jgi:hypothetical protein
MGDIEILEVVPSLFDCLFGEEGRLLALYMSRCGVICS